MKFHVPNASEEVMAALDPAWGPHKQRMREEKRRLDIAEEKLRLFLEENHGPDRITPMVEAIKTLTTRFRIVARCRLSGMSLKKTGEWLGVSAERARQLEIIANRRLSRLLPGIQKAI